MVLEGRLHPCTLLFGVWNAVRNVLIPLVVVLLFGRRREGDAYVLPFLFVGVFFLGLPIALTVVRYFTFTYRIIHGELIVRHGVLGRTERHIPLNRVQDIRLEQRLLHRLCGMVEVHVETAGGRGAEASLSVLSRQEAERLRAAVFAPASLAGAPALAADRPVAPTAETELVRRLGLRDLVLAGLTSNRIASALAIVFVAWQFVDDVLPRETYERLLLRGFQQTERWLHQGGQTQWQLVLALAAGVMLVGLLFSVIGSVIVFYGFTLSRKGEDLHRAYGLLTRRASSLPRRRIQVLKVEETWLRRMFRLAALRADTAGSRQQDREAEGAGRDVLLPMLRRGEVEGLLPVFFPDLDGEGTVWRQVSRKAISRGTFKGALLCVVLAAVSAGLQRHWLGLWPLALLPLVYASNVMSFRYLGYALSERYFRTRRGWLSRATHIVPIRNAQAIVVRQTPFDRRHGVATLVVDTAGQTNTGGAPKIHNLPLEEARGLARTLARQAAATRYRW
jgi:putative membrane protein